MLTQHRVGEPVESLEPVLSGAEVVALQQAVRAVRVDDVLNEYLLDVVTATRNHPDIYLGASTRAALGLYRAAQAKALLDGRDYVVPDDIKELAQPVLAHRVLAKGFRQGERGDAAGQVLAEILRGTTVPA